MFRKKYILPLLFTGLCFQTTPCQAAGENNIPEMALDGAKIVGALFVLNWVCQALQTAGHAAVAKLATDGPLHVSLGTPLFPKTTKRININGKRKDVSTLINNIRNALFRTNSFSLNGILPLGSTIIANQPASKVKRIALALAKGAVSIAAGYAVLCGVVAGKEYLQSHDAKSATLTGIKYGYRAFTGAYSNIHHDSRPELFLVGWACWNVLRDILNCALPVTSHETGAQLWQEAGADSSMLEVGHYIALACTMIGIPLVLYKIQTSGSRSSSGGGGSDSGGNSGK